MPVTEYKEFKVDLSKTEAQFQNLGDKALAVAKSLVAVKTGRLRSALRCKATETGYTIYAEPPMHAIVHLLEDGTKHSAPRPFLRPTAIKMQTQNRKVIAKIINSAVKLEVAK